MAELVAVQSGLALYKAGDVGVIIDTVDLNPYDPQPLEMILASGEWTEPTGTDKAVLRLCDELADAALDGVTTDVTMAASANDVRVVRVPKKVQTAVKAGLDVIKASDDYNVPLLAVGVAEKLATGTATVDTVKRAYARLATDSSDGVSLMFGGDAGREWAAKVCGVTATITAASDPMADDAATDEPVPPSDSDWVDPDQPHEFVVLVAGDQDCAICGRPMDDPIHVAVTRDDDGASSPSSASDDMTESSVDGDLEPTSGITYFATFVPGGDVGPTFMVDQLLALDDTGAWWIREAGEWSPTQAPDASADIVQLDNESYLATQAQLDEPGAAYAELSISEKRLFELAAPGLRLDVLEAVFAAAPFVPTAVRSANAEKQLRDSKGHFIESGGTVMDTAGNRGTIVGSDHANGTVQVKVADGSIRTIPANEVTVDPNGAAPSGDDSGAPSAADTAVARLEGPVTLVPDVHTLIDQTVAAWKKEAGTDPETDDSAPPSTVAAGAADDPLIPPDAPVPSSATPSASGPPADTTDDASVAGDPVDDSPVPPLYLAEVDPQDTGAVLAVLAVIPAQTEGANITVYKREPGQWQLDDDDRQTIQGPTPPPLVQLTPDMLQNVLSQVDQRQGGDDAGTSDDASSATPAPVAAAGFAMLQKFAIAETGLTASQTIGARLLVPYRGPETWPLDVTEHLNEFVAGKEVTPEDFKSTERLRQYWTHGEGAAKIRWGEPNDWYRCVDELGKYLGDRAKGYCTLRHHDALGVWPGQEDGGKDHHDGGVHASGVDLSTLVADAGMFDPDMPHDYDPGTDGMCSTCGRDPLHQVHMVVIALPDMDEASPSSTGSDDDDSSSSVADELLEQDEDASTTSGTPIMSDDDDSEGAGTRLLKELIQAHEAEHGDDSSSSSSSLPSLTDDDDSSSSSSSSPVGDDTASAPNEPAMVEIVSVQHSYTPGPEGLCECGLPIDGSVHTDAGLVPDSMQDPDDDDLGAMTSFADISAESRKEAAQKGQALPDGSYPIRNTSDLKNAIRAVGRAKNGPKVKRHIIKRARALGKTKLLPDTWKVASSIELLITTDGLTSNYAIAHPYALAAAQVEGEEPSCECGRPHADVMHVLAVPTLLADASIMETGQRFRIPLVVPEGVESGDGRTFAMDSLTSRPMPLALMWQPEGDEGHNGSVIVGRVDHVERIDDGLGDAYGVFDSGPWGQEALRLVRAGMLRGISADLDEFSANVLGGGEDADHVTNTKLLVTSGRLMGITLVAKPAYAECVIELVDGDGQGDDQVPDGEYTQETGDARIAALIASAAPLNPPTDWFENPSLDKATHLTIDDDGRVFGHIASWDVDHIGLPFGTRAPKSHSNYAYFRTGVVRTAEGGDVHVGQLTLTGGHAPLRATAQQAVKHYDDTSSAVADVTAGEDKFGIWVAGALRPGVTPEQVRVLRASSPSGDWRPIKGALELVAVCQVNVPGFPVARSLVSGGQVMALVAAGCIAPPEPDAVTMTKAEIDARIATLEADAQRRWAKEAWAIRDRMATPIKEHNDALAASAAAARARVDVIRQEKRSALTAAALAAMERVHPGRTEELQTKAAELKARVAAGGLDVVPFDSGKHPRDDKGRFRQILARLENIFHGDASAQHAAAGGIQKVEDAASKEAEGDHSGAAKAAHAGAAELETAAKSATGEAKKKLANAATTVKQAASAHDDEHGNGVAYNVLPEPVKELLDDAVTRAEQKLDPANPEELWEKIKAFITGTNVMSPRDIAKFIKNQIKRDVDPNLFEKGKGAVVPKVAPTPAPSQGPAPGLVPS